MPRPPTHGRGDRRDLPIGRPVVRDRPFCRAVASASMARRDEGKGMVLLVDDDASIRDSLRMILEFEGYRVEEAHSGAAALARIADTQPEAVLLDIKMPEMDGLAALRAFREPGYDKPVLMISGPGGVGPPVEAAKRGAYDFFEKPAQAERVLVRLGHADEAWRPERRN